MLCLWLLQTYLVYFVLTFALTYLKNSDQGIFRIELSPDKRKSTLVVNLVESAVPDGQFEPFKNFCVPLVICYQLGNKSLIFC